MTEMSFDSQTRPLSRNDITVQVIGVEVMLYDSDNEKIHVLNHSAYAIWKLCTGENTPEDMYDILSAQYPDARLNLFNDIRETLETFRQKMLFI